MVEKLGIAGSGAIACGLAALAATQSDVVLWARSQDSAQRAEERVQRLLTKLGSNGGSVRVATDTEILADATYVVEAIVEDLDAKAALLREIAERVAPESVLATTTSSLCIESLAEAAGRPELFAGLHVFNPVHKMKLVEVIFPAGASAQTRTRTKRLCEALGKTAVEVPNVPGFVVNRLLFPFLFSAVELLEETGMAVEDVDTCMKLGAGHPLGPLALLDLIGLDVAQAIGPMINCDVPARIDAMVAEGHLGRKAGRGFYAY